jgi:2-dehydro-3-deoxygalactonokinase
LPPSLIAIDWGTSNLRASLLDAAGHAIESRSAPGGIMAVQGGQFSQALMALCGDWVRELACPLIASGMIGSRQGWKEAPYLDCPANVAAAAQVLTPVEIDTGDAARPRQLHIVAGLRCREANGQFDVMRGEETQIWGAGVAAGSLCVLPGTHSKWAWVGEGGAITRFRTYMTGELYGLLTQHGILGRLMAFGTASPDDFRTGVRVGLASHADATHAIFSARTAGLMGSIAPEGLPDYLSGMLIGIELGSALASAGAALAGASVTLIGDDALCSRYEMAFELQGMSTRRAPDDATLVGQRRIAQASGLMGAVA